MNTPRGKVTNNLIQSLDKKLYATMKDMSRLGLGFTPKWHIFVDHVTKQLQ
jgi:hypothetical protein